MLKIDYSFLLVTNGKVAHFIHFTVFQWNCPCKHNLMPLFSQLTLHSQRSNRQKTRNGLKYITGRPLFGRFAKKSGRFLLDKKRIPYIIAPAEQVRVEGDSKLSVLRPYVSMSSKKMPRGALGESYYSERVIDTENL